LRPESEDLNMLKRTVSCLLLLMLASSAWGDRLFVRNRPFSGYVLGTANPASIEVDLGDLCKALEVKLEEVEGHWVVRRNPSDPLPKFDQNPGSLYVNGQPVKYRVDSGHRLVKLSEFSQAIGGKLARHPEAGTIDLNLGVAKVNTAGAYKIDKHRLVYYGADWAPACKMFLPVVVEFDHKQIIPVAYVDCKQPRSANYRNFIRYFNGNRIPYTVLLSPENRVVKTWTGYQDLAPFTQQILEVLDAANAPKP